MPCRCCPGGAGRAGRPQHPRPPLLVPSRWGTHEALATERSTTERSAHFWTNGPDATHRQPGRRSRPWRGTRSPCCSQPGRPTRWPVPGALGIWLTQDAFSAGPLVASDPALSQLRGPAGKLKSAVRNAASHATLTSQPGRSGAEGGPRKDAVHDGTTPRPGSPATVLVSGVSVGTMISSSDAHVRFGARLPSGRVSGPHPVGGIAPRRAGGYRPAGADSPTSRITRTRRLPHPPSGLRPAGRALPRSGHPRCRAPDRIGQLTAAQSR